jgi:hypothetical protein
MYKQSRQIYCADKSFGKSGVQFKTKHDIQGSVSMAESTSISQPLQHRIENA